MKKSAIARIGRVLAVCLILALLPGALAQTQAVIKQDTYVFKKPDVTSAHLKVKKGTTVELVASKGQWALVEKNGYMAFLNKAQLSVKTNAVDESNKEPAVLLETVRVYKAPSRSSASPLSLTTPSSGILWHPCGYHSSYFLIHKPSRSAHWQMQGRIGGWG